jgi:hypothetical protein
MSEPRILFYAPTTPSMTYLTNLPFLAADGSAAIKAGDFSGKRQIAIWNNPNSGGTMDPASPPPGGYGNTGADPDNPIDGVVKALSVDITSRDNAAGGAVTDVVTGRWLNIFFPNGNGADAEANQPAGSPGNADGGKYVGMNGATSQAAVIGTINPNSYFLVEARLKPPGTALSGSRNFVMRVSYSFQ